MADRFDKSHARRPAAESVRRDDMAELPEDDPLVELARIVSGNESFDQILGSRNQPPEPVRPAAPPVRGAAQPRDTSFDLEAELMNDLHSTFDPAAREPARRPARPPEPAAVRPPPRAVAPQPPLDDYEPAVGRAAAPRVGGDTDPYVAVPDFGRGRVAPQATRRAAPPVEEPPLDDRDYDEDDYLEDDAADYDDGDDLYLDEPDFEDEKPRRSRKALITAGVIALVLVAGGLGAYALMGRSSVTGGGTPQVIAADDGPTKVEPEPQPTQTANAEQNKLIYDRVDPDQSSPDQLPPPADSGVTDPAQSNESEASREISRIILPGSPGDQSTTPAVPGMSDALPAEGGDDVGPRKVRTVVVKPDGTIVSSEAAPRGSDGTADTGNAVADTAIPAPAADAATPAASAPDMVAPDTGAIDPADQTATAEPLPGTPAKDNSQLAAPEPQPEPEEVAAAPTVAPEAPPAAAPVTGGFVVQVTSQRSEAAASSAYANLARKFPSVFGDRPADIARADLGAKGVYYRARVGPMATRDEAVRFCEQLRAAGGDCIVQRN